MYLHNFTSPFLIQNFITLVQKFDFSNCFEALDTYCFTVAQCIWQIYWVNIIYTFEVQRPFKTAKSQKLESEMLLDLAVVYLFPLC